MSTDKLSIQRPEKKPGVGDVVFIFQNRELRCFTTGNGESFEKIAQKCIAIRKEVLSVFLEKILEEEESEKLKLQIDSVSSEKTFFITKSTYLEFKEIIEKIKSEILSIMCKDCFLLAGDRIIPLLDLLDLLDNPFSLFSNITDTHKSCPKQLLRFIKPNLIFSEGFKKLPKNSTIYIKKP